MTINIFNISRRQFIQGVTVGVPITLGLYAWQIEPSWVDMVTRTMPIRNLPAELEGASLVQISDIHIGNRFDYGYIVDTLRTIQADPPDFIVYTGDFITYESSEQFAQLREVLPLFPVGKQGTAAILGNHDYGRGWSMPEVADSVVTALEEFNIPVLRNEMLTVTGLTIAGVDDLWGTNFAPYSMLSQLDPAAHTVVLAHNPDILDLPIWEGYQGWVLSGHTHGGQVKPPFLPPPLIPCQNNRYTSGLFHFDDGRTLYINRGLGNLWQVRFNVRPEVTRFVLTSA